MAETVGTKKWYQSKAVWAAIIAAIIGGVQGIGQATGHPIVIPQWVEFVLGGLGLYSLRVGQKPVE